jgi:C-terminal peptidase prc
MESTRDKFALFPVVALVAALAAVAGFDTATSSGRDHSQAQGAQAPEEKPESEDGEEKYWSGVTFGEEQFDEVLQYVQEEYIDDKVDASRGYVSAANFVLSALEPAYELVPRDYYGKHKADPAVEFQAADREELYAKRKEHFRGQNDELQAAWKKAAFTRDDFLKVMKFAGKEAEKENGKEKGKKKVDANHLWIAAAQGFLYALDPHSSLVSKAAWEESTKETQDASFDGIGALLTQRFEPSRTLENRLQGKTREVDGKAPYLMVQLKEEDKLQRRTFVESPMAGQPAEKAGVWAGDEIVKVDDASTVDLPLDDVVSKIRGPRGTKVKLTVLREGAPGEQVIEVERARIRVTNVEGHLIDSYPCVGYVKLTGFIETSYDSLRAEVLRLNELCSQDGEGLRALVFDLRNNSGGLLSQGVMIADLFLETGKIVTVKNRRPSLFRLLEGEDEVRVAKPKDTLTMPLVVLVNDGSASASEIVASALQDNGRAIIVGERTFGKASVQTLENPIKGAGYYVKLTIARYYAPSGRTLQVVGVQPDVETPPEVGGKMPVSFREEDLSNHLPKIDAEYVSANKDLTEKLSACVSKRGIAEKIFKDNPHPQIKFDYQLYRGADYAVCLADEKGLQPASAQ